MDPHLIAQVTALEPQLFAIFQRESSRSDKAKSLVNLLFIVASLLIGVFRRNEWVFCVIAAICLVSLVSSLVFYVIDEFGLVDRQRWLQTPRSRAKNEVRLHTFYLWMATTGCILMAIFATHQFYKLSALSEDRWVYDSVICFYVFGFCLMAACAALARLLRFESERKLYRIVMTEDRNLVNDQEYFVA